MRTRSLLTSKMKKTSSENKEESYLMFENKEASQLISEDEGSQLMSEDEEESQLMFENKEQLTFESEEQQLNLGMLSHYIIINCSLTISL